MSAQRTAAAKAGIVYHAQQCEGALRLAAFADAEPTLSPGIATGMRKLAAYHSAHAFQWAQALAPVGARA